MNKSDLIEKLTDRQKQLTSDDVDLVVNNLIDQMAEALMQGEKIKVGGFGSFSVRYREPRAGRNPKTGESVEVAGRLIPYFKPGKKLREEINES